MRGVHFKSIYIKLPTSDISCMVGIALEQYNFAQLLPPDLGNFASGDLRERREKVGVGLN